MHPLIPGLLLLLIMLTGTGCSKEAQPPVTTDGVDFDLNLELVLESEELAFPGGPFQTIVAVRAYGESGFIATDYHNRQILQLDRDGNVIRRIGREGRGPGEFTGGIGNVIPLRDGRFGVPDIGNARNIIFDAEGNAVMHNDKHPEEPYLAAKVYPLEGGGYLTPSYRWHYEEYSDCLFVELDRDLRSLDPCYGSYDALNESDNEFLQRNSQYAVFGDIHFVEENRFIFVRSSYDGTHYFYRRTADNWVIDSTATGYVRVPASVTSTTYIPPPSGLNMNPSNPQIPDDMPSLPPNYVGRSSQEEGEAAVIWHNRSMGYEVYDDRYLLHFTLIDPGRDARIPGVELWTIDGTYLGYQRLDFLEDQYDGLGQGGLRTGLRFRAYNDGRLVLSAPQAFYIFDVELVVSGQIRNPDGS